MLLIMGIYQRVRSELRMWSVDMSEVDGCVRLGNGKPLQIDLQPWLRCGGVPVLENEHQ